MSEVKSYVDIVLAKGDLCKMPTWKVYGGKNARTDPIVASSEYQGLSMAEGSITWDMTKEYLKDNLVLLPAGVYMIHFKPTSKEQNDKVIQIFTVTSDTHIAGAQLPANQQQSFFSPQMFMGILEGKFTAELQAQNARMESMFERRLQADKISELEKKLKEKNKPTSSTLESIAKIGLPYLEKLIKGESIAPVKVAIAGNGAANVPANAASTKDEEFEEVGEEEKKVLYDIQEQSIKDLITFFGGEREMIIEMHCLSQLLIERDMDWYNTLIAPQCLDYKTKLNERGVDTDY